jgi:TubC N-terminal docking domain
MNVFDLVTNLNQQGVQLWAEQDKLKINSPKGILTPQLQADIVLHKTEILAFLREERVENDDTPTQLSLQSIGRLIGGFCQQCLEDSADRFPAIPPTSAGKPPVIDPAVMAQRVKVTFRPLPEGFKNATVLQFREELQLKLERYGVQIIPWEHATREFSYDLPIPWVKRSRQMRVVKPDIHAVIDVERPVNKIKGTAAEIFYQIYKRWFCRDRSLSVAKIVQLMSWAEDHAMQRLEDPTATQVILIRNLDPAFVDSQVSYQRKIAIGIHTLVSQFAEIVIGVSDETISILNMNLSDSQFPRDRLDRFVFKSLIPKIYVPIAPLPMSQFAIGTYDPAQSNAAHKLIQLSQALAQTDLFPSGFKLDEVIHRSSHRDIVDAIVNGRTGVSYGFVAYAEPPQYVGAREISQLEWASLSPVQGFSPDEVRQNAIDRRYIKTSVKQQDVYLQIPDIWLVCSRSGANKTNLNLHSDVLRLGLKNQLCLQLPAGIDPNAVDIRPSYDTYVMVAIVLAAALYAPELIATGAPMIHFHGYPAQSWFAANEAYTGIDNPSVPCGTFESGVFNFLGIHRLANESNHPLVLAGLIEPDHGINLIAPELDYLLARLATGLQQHQIELGGKHFASLMRNPS